MNITVAECNHCFQEEYAGGPFACSKCGQRALVFPVPVAKLSDMRDACEAGEWNAAWLWHRMANDVERRGLVHYFEGVVAKLKQLRAALDVLDVQRTIESCKREPKRVNETAKVKQNLAEILANIEIRI